MKSFLERSPIIIGVISLVVIIAGTLGAVLLDSGVLPFNKPYQVTGEFSDAAGLRPGDSVMVAGVRSGQIASVQPSGDGESIIIEFDVKKGVELPANTRAEIQVDTVLGSKSLLLRVPDPTRDRRVEPDWSSTLEDVSEIALANTKTPFETIDLQDIGTELTTETDADALNQLITSLAEITDGTRDDVTAVVENLNDITEAVNTREDEAKSLLDASAQLTSTLADRDEELKTLIDQLARLVTNLNDQSDEVIILLGETAATSESLGSLLGDHRADLDAIFEDLDATLAVIDQRQVDLATGIAYSASAIEGFSGIGYSGPDRVPHPWANIFLQGAGPAGIEPVLGGCGILDIALDVVLGPDPLPCDERDGPLGAAAGGGRATVFSGEADGSSRVLVDFVLDAAGVSR